MVPRANSIPEPPGGAIRWGSAAAADLASPEAVRALLERAIESRPTNAVLRLKLANVHLDRYDFAAAAGELEVALRLDVELEDARRRLARCYNMLRRHQDTLDVLRRCNGPVYERGLAYAALGREADAVREYRQVLADDPQHNHACRRLSKLLRASGEVEALADICETLHARGVGHAQLLYTWGTALALAGRDDEARAVLLDASRVTELSLPLPDGFADHAAFNSALAGEILTNPNRLSNFPIEDEANRGSSRVHALFAGRRPELFRALLESLQQAIDGHRTPAAGSFDPWSNARPVQARLRGWGLIQRGGDYEEWHSHPGGWISGVYYVRVPGIVSASGEGPGCIEFGPPPPVARARPDLIPIMRRVPRAGTLLLAPSHYAHRTIPTGADENRISFAFDVVPDREPAAPGDGIR